MRTYQIIILFVASIIFIITAAIFFILKKKHHEKVLFPPVFSGCPSPGWMAVTDSSGNPICVPQYDIPGNKCPTQLPYIGNTGRIGVCQALACATECNVPWDGITGNPQYIEKCKNSFAVCSGS